LHGLFCFLDHRNQELRVAAVIQGLEKERDDVKDELLKLTNEFEQFTNEMTNQKKDHNKKVKLLEKEKDDLKKERDAMEDLLSKLRAECNMKVKREKAELIETNEKQVKQLEELKDAIQHTKSGLRFLTAPEKGKMGL